MAAPERFAEMSDSSCTAGAVHTWHFSRHARLAVTMSAFGEDRKLDFEAVRSVDDPHLTLVSVPDFFYRCSLRQINLSVSPAPYDDVLIVLSHCVTHQTGVGWGRDR